MFFNDIVNADNQKLILHKDELTRYLNGDANTLIALEVDLTLSCNHRCPECTFTGYHEKGWALPQAIMDKIAAEASSLGVKGMIITGGGEPCLHPGLGEFVENITRKGIDITLTTNGQFISRHFEALMRNLKRIRFSVDAASAAVFRSTHGMPEKDFNEVIASLRKTVSYKKNNNLPVDIGVSFMTSNHNMDEIYGAVDFFKSIGVDFLHFKPMQLWDKALGRYYHKRYEGLDKLFRELDKYNESGFRISISRHDYYKGNPNRLAYSTCHGAHFNMIIGADGKAYTCCHFKYNPKYCYGDLYQESITDIAKKVKSSVTEDCFADCKMDSLNQFVEYAIANRDQVLRISKDIDPKELPLGSKWL